MNIGDLVRLKSGGPKMTVREVGKNPDGAWAICEWFDSDRDSQRRAFVAETLEVWIEAEVSVS